jgi:hypothetical protein
VLTIRARHTIDYCPAEENPDNGGEINGGEIRAERDYSLW